MPGSRGDKKLHITFNEMGHGDNVLIALPNGKMVVIDCGTMRWDRNFWVSNPPVAVLRQNAFINVLGDAKFLLNNKTIDLLILTHPDKDHCSELSSLFTDIEAPNPESDEKNPKIPKTITYKAAAQATMVFYSSNFSEFGKHGVPNLLLSGKKAGGVFALTMNQSTSTFGKVTAHSYKGTTLATKAITASVDDKAEIMKKSALAATKNFVKVIDGTADDGIDCGVYFLASNVVPYANISTDNSTQENRGSIVTMIVYGDKKFLFMGDSTSQTEAFLVQTYGDLLKDIELLHIPHHASFATSSTPAFVSRVNPRYAAITAAWDAGPQLALPRGEIIGRYQAGARILDKSADVQAEMKTINCYKFATVTVTVTDKTGKPMTDKTGKPLTKTGSGNLIGQLDTPKQIWCTGSHGPIDFSYEKKADGTVDLV